MLNEPHSGEGFKLEGVAYRYSGQKSAVLLGITLDLTPAKFYALVGPSGSGKSTLLRLLAGIDRPTSGTVKWGGLEVAEIPARDRNFGIVFQDAPLYPEKTVEAVVRFPLDCGRCPKVGNLDESVRRALEVLGLVSLRNRHPSTLSGGERQRVSLARLLVWSPRVMLLDEPLSAVDHDRRPDLIRVLRDIQSESKSTVVYVTHDQIDVFAAADRVAVLIDGSVGQIGAPEIVYRSPASGLVGRLVGDGPLSLIEGNVQFVGNKTVVRCSSELTVVGSLSLQSTCGHTTHPCNVRIGFRPEDVLLKSQSLRNDILTMGSSKAVVQSCFFVGSRYLVKIDSPAGPLFAWHHERLESGAIVFFAFISKSILLFDASAKNLIGTLQSDEDDSADSRIDIAALAPRCSE